MTALCIFKWMLYPFIWLPGHPDCRDINYGYVTFPPCMVSPNEVACWGCRGRWDFDHDDDVDLQDFARMQALEWCY